MVQRNSSSAEAMTVDLSPKRPSKAYGGACYEWSPSELPMLRAASIGAAKLSLAAGGLALPSGIVKLSTNQRMPQAASDKGREGADLVVGMDGTRAEGGCLFIVPRFFADDTGMEWFSIIFSHLAGRTTPDMEKLFRSKRLDSEIFFNSLFKPAAALQPLVLSESLKTVQPYQ
uniref:Uncharacterized protein n=1 Tax=Leersia perrieri TaxID=77586 RepID=A0A0D9VAY7_9ORYZ